MPPKKKITRFRSPKPGTSKETEKSGLFSIPYKPGSFLKLLEGRQMGTVQNYNFPQNSHRMKVQDYNLVRSHRFGKAEEHHTTYFLRPGKNALVAAWYFEFKENCFTSLVGMLHYDLRKVEVGSTKFVQSKFSIIDACQAYANPDIFVFISRDSYQKLGNVHVGVYQDEEIVYYPYAHPTKKDFNAVNAHTHSGRFAVGADKEVCIYTVTGLKEVRLLPDNIYSVAYNKSGSLLHMGCENGDFIVYDLRSMSTVQRIKLDNQIIDDVLVLSDENYCLVSGVSSCLMKVDLRNSKKLFDFPDHKRRSKKIPVSANEKLNLVSCTGADEKTRIWCLKTGNLLKSFGVPSTYDARSCFVPNSYRGHIYLVQDNFIHVYSILQ